MKSNDLSGRTYVTAGNIMRYKHKWEEKYSSNFLMLFLDRNRGFHYLINLETTVVERMEIPKDYYDIEFTNPSELNPTELKNLTGLLGEIPSSLHDLSLKVEQMAKSTPLFPGCTVPRRIA